MLVLLGESASGKSTVEKELCKSYGYSKVVTYTTRQPREKEVDDVDYHFITDEEFLKKEKEGFFAETAVYNNWHYGSAKEDYTRGKVIVLTPSGLRKILRNQILRNEVVSAYISTDRKSRLIKILERNDNIEEAKRRDSSDVGQFDEVSEEVDIVVSNDGYTRSPEDMVRIVDYQYKLALQEKRKIKTILCDIDSVVNNLIEAYLKKYNRLYSDNLKIEDITEYSLDGFVKKEAAGKFEEICDDEFLSSLVAKPGAIDSINYLMSNYDFYFITSKRPKSIPITDEWLKKLFPTYNNSMLIISQNKKLVHGDILIDDCLGNFILDINKVSNVRYNFVFDRPWNKEYKADAKRTFRVFNWNDILSCIHELQLINNIGKV